MQTSPRWWLRNRLCSPVWVTRPSSSVRWDGKIFEIAQKIFAPSTLQVHASPHAEVVWYRGTLVLEPDNRMYREDVGTRRSLVIHHVREEEFSVYR